MEGDEAWANSDFKKANACYKQCVHPTAAHVAVVRMLLSVHLPNVVVQVAPYEADPQLANAVRTGQADIVLSEDGDMLPYGCPRVLFKMNKGKRESRSAGIPGEGELMVLDHILSESAAVDEPLPPRATSSDKTTACKSDVGSVVFLYDCYRTRSLGEISDTFIDMSSFKLLDHLLLLIIT